MSLQQAVRQDLVIVPPATGSNSADPLGLTAHRLAAEALEGPICDAIRARSIKRDRGRKRIDLGATQRASAWEAGEAAGLPFGGSKRRSQAMELNEEGREFERPARVNLAPSKASDASRVSIAVAPFTVASLAGQDAAFAEMLKDGVISALYRHHDVEVQLPPAVTDKGITLEETKPLKEAGLSHVLFGSVAILGGEVRLMSKLLDLHSGRFVWIHHFDRQLPQSLRSIADLANEVTTSVLSGIAEICTSRTVGLRSE